MLLSGRSACFLIDTSVSINTSALDFSILLLVRIVLPRPVDATCLHFHYDIAQDVIAHLKKESHAQIYSSAMSPPVARQTLAATQAIMGIDGTGEGQRRIRQLKDNTMLVRFITLILGL